MIKYDKLFDILRKRGLGQNKFCVDNSISTSQLQRLRQNQVVYTSTLDTILKALDLDSLDDISEFINDDKNN